MKNNTSQITPAGFVSLLLGISLALILCGSITFFIGFLLMLKVFGLVMLFYVAGIVSRIVPVDSKMCNCPCGIHGGVQSESGRFDWVDATQLEGSVGFGVQSESEWKVSVFFKVPFPANIMISMAFTAVTVVWWDEKRHRERDRERTDDECMMTLLSSPVSVQSCRNRLLNVDPQTL
ncbi:hypothetical protein L2E82_28340 [Cichorium intybus]|uniref:Uncharacterized protein n=2 Tax=Cichorium intybus TaxID=13427 RepID=A0ACB9CVH3_CICIN|nr:hypothetical protein L2E82_28332 [Cichorium intybus]KAI3738314.1 hypothetical protein L2E82_28340 [Cichorium intybus]